MTKITKMKLTQEEFNLIQQMDGLIAMINDEFNIDLSYSSYLNDADTFFGILNDFGIGVEIEEAE